MASFQPLYGCKTTAKKSEASISTVTQQINMEIGVLHFKMNGDLNDTVPFLSLFSGSRPSSVGAGGRFGPDTGLMNEQDDL